MTSQCSNIWILLYFLDPEVQNSDLLSIVFAKYTGIKEPRHVISNNVAF